jgi:hypothetical protein
MAEAHLSEVVQIYVPLTEHTEYKSGLAERYLRKRLKQHGWRVWHTSCFASARHPELYPLIRSLYEELCYLLEKQRPGIVSSLEFLARSYHGMPEFICYRSGVFKFITCKFEQEKVPRSQRYTMLKLLELGFIVEVHTLVDKNTKALQAYLDVQTGNRRVTEAQLTISAAQRRAEKNLDEQWSAD